MVLKNNKGSGLSFILLGCFIIVFMVINNIEILNNQIYHYEKNKKENVVENSVELFNSNRKDTALELLKDKNIVINKAILITKTKTNFNVNSLNNDLIKKNNINAQQLHDVINTETNEKINKKLDTFIESNESKMYIMICTTNYKQSGNNTEIIYCRKY